MLHMESITDIPFVGGHLAIDFVNTTEQRGHPDARDWLQTASDLQTWGERSGLLTRSTRTGGGEAELERARRARELVHGLLLDRSEGRPLTSGQLARLQRLAAEAYAAGKLARQDDGRVEWYWSATTLSTVRYVAVTGAVELLRTHPSPRLKQCPGDHCGWLFLDTTKRGNRRWCSMSECGQDAKDERRRARRHARS
jgi:predicted RNA-binding Zn ribbon-like protein